MRIHNSFQELCCRGEQRNFLAFLGSQVSVHEVVSKNTSPSRLPHGVLDAPALRVSQAVLGEAGSASASVPALKAGGGQQQGCLDP